MQDAFLSRTEMKKKEEFNSLSVKSVHRLIEIIILRIIKMNNLYMKKGNKVKTQKKFKT